MDYLGNAGHLNDGSLLDRLAPGPRCDAGPLGRLCGVHLLKKDINLLWRGG
jgi:hypothetical protein